MKLLIVGVVFLFMLASVTTIYCIANMFSSLLQALPLMILVVFIIMVVPMVGIILCLLVLFSGPEIYEWITRLLPLYPFWFILSATTAHQLFIVFKSKIGLDKTFLKSVALLAMLASWAVLYDMPEGLGSVHGIACPFLAGFLIFIIAVLTPRRRQIKLILSALLFAFLILDAQVLPYLLKFKETFVGGIRSVFAGDASALRQATSLDWFFNTAALLVLGMLFRTRRIRRVLLIILFLIFSISSLLTFSRGAFLGLGTGALSLIIFKVRPFFSNFSSKKSNKWKILLSLLGICILVTLLIVASRSAGVWEYAIEHKGLEREILLAERGEEVGRLSLLVSGIRQIPKYLFVGKGAVGATFHSSIIDISVNYGAVYAIILWIFILSLFKRSYLLASHFEGSQRERSIESAIALGTFCSFAGAIAQAVFDPVLFSLHFTVVFWLLRGIEYSLWRFARRDQMIG